MRGTSNSSIHSPEQKIRKALRKPWHQSMMTNHVVVGNGVDCVEKTQVVFVGSVVAVPSYHIEWRVVVLGEGETSE